MVLAHEPIERRDLQTAGGDGGPDDEPGDARARAALEHHVEDGHPDAHGDLAETRADDQGVDGRLGRLVEGAHKSAPEADEETKPRAEVRQTDGDSQHVAVHAEGRLPEHGSALHLAVHRVEREQLGSACHHEAHQAEASAEKPESRKPDMARGDGRGGSSKSTR